MPETNQYQVSWEQFERDIKVLARKIKKHPHQFRALYGIPRGGLVVAVRLSHTLEIPLVEEVSEDGDTLVVDDVSDTGKTLMQWDDFAIGTLYKKDGTMVEPTFCTRTINKWIVFPWENKGKGGDK